MLFSRSYFCFYRFCLGQNFLSIIQRYFYIFFVSLKAHRFQFFYVFQHKYNSCISLKIKAEQCGICSSIFWHCNVLQLSKAHIKFRFIFIAT